MANLKSNAATRMENIFELTRTDDIPNNYEILRLHDTKEIAARVRAELRKRFPMFKWSVRSDRNSIDISIKQSPWSKDEDIFRAVAHFAASLLKSYNYDNSDIMTDYFDVNFYGTHESGIPAWDMVVIEETDELRAIREQFDIDNNAFIRADSERKAKEFAERMALREAEQAEAKKRRAEEKIIIDRVHENAIVSDADYYVKDAVTLGSKNCTVSDYIESLEDCEEPEMSDVHVVREVTLSAEDYAFFADHLLADWNFLAGMGGSATNDPRINSMSDYSMMATSERESVKWYVENAVAIICDGEIKALVDPQGYDYARYVYFVNDCEIENEVPVAKEDESILADREAAKVLADIDKAVSDSVGSFEFESYKSAFEEAVNASGARFDKSSIRQITDETVKTLMYRVYDHWSGVQATFARSGLQPGQEITIFKLSDIGGICTMHGKFIKAECCSYAQYDDAVKLVFRPKRKRTDYYFFVHGDILIYPGDIDIPENLLYEIRESNGFVTKRSKYMSFDHEQYSVIEKYLDYISPLVRIIRE